MRTTLTELNSDNLPTAARPVLVFKEADIFTRAHYAAFRGWLQGLPVEFLAGRYLMHADDEMPPERRDTLAVLMALGDQLVQRAHRHGRPELAAALLRDVRNSDRATSAAIAAVNTLESLGTPQPALSNAVELWFAPALARRLRTAGLVNLDVLLEFLHDCGHSWWRRVPKIGMKAAAVIVGWLQDHEKPLGRAVGAHVTRSLTMPALPAKRQPVTIDAATTAVPPLEAIRLPAYADGSSGENRGDHAHCGLTARNDYEAILTWLSLWPSGSETWRAYRKEAERFLAWAVIERAKPISSLKTEDCIAYRDFLANPLPAARWCVKKDEKTGKTPTFTRDQPGWRPFLKPLAVRSQRYTMTVLKSMCEFLARKRYLADNPWDGVPPPKFDTRIKIEKALPRDLWDRFAAWLDAGAEDPEAKQLRAARAALFLLRDTGMRRAEACRADRAGWMPLDDPANPVAGEVTILGKGSNVREVPVSQRALEALRAHWSDRGEDFDAALDGPLLVPLATLRTQRALAKAERGERGFAPSGLHTLVKTIAKRFGESLSEVDAAAGERAKRTRAHALRHTFGVHAADDNVPVDVLQSIFGHKSMETTTIYTQPGKKRRVREIGKLYRHS